MRTSILLPFAVASVLAAFGQWTDPVEVRLAASAKGTLVAAAAAQQLGVRPTVLVYHEATDEAAIDDLRTGRSRLALAAIADTADLVGFAGSPVATRGLVFVAHPHRNLTGLTGQQVADLLTGRIVNWRQLQGVDAPVRFQPPDLAASSRLERTFGVTIAPAQHRADSDRACQRLVTGDPFAIGCMSFAAAERAVEAGAPLQILALDDIAPSHAAIAAGQWPLADTLWLLARADDTGSLEPLRSLLASPAGAALLVEQGYSIEPRE